MGVEIGTGLLVGTIIFVGLGVASAFGLSFYVKQKTREISMKNDNAR